MSRVSHRIYAKNIKCVSDIAYTVIPMLIVIILICHNCVESSSLLIDQMLNDNNVVALNDIHMDSHGFELTQANNLQRQELIQKICDHSDSVTFNKSLDDIPDDQLEHLIVDTKHKFLYCYVPKVACTNWKRVLMLMTNQWTNGTDPLKIPAALAHSPGMFQKFNALTTAERDIVLTEYTRFVIARHPFERLLSAYRNKLEGDLPSARYFQERIGKQIIKSFRPNAATESLNRGHDVTFNEFIMYLLTPELSMNYVANQTAFNEHWEPINKLCHPCAVRYNIVGKYETLIDDSALALHLVGVTNLTFPSSQRTSGTGELLRKYFSAVPLGVTRSVYRLYRDDFKLFGYSLEDVLGYELD